MQRPQAAFEHARSLTGEPRDRAIGAATRIREMTGGTGGEYPLARREQWVGGFAGQLPGVTQVGRIRDALLGRDASEKHEKYYEQARREEVSGHGSFRHFERQVTWILPATPSPCRSR